MYTRKVSGEVEMKSEKKWNLNLVTRSALAVAFPSPHIGRSRCISARWAKSYAVCRITRWIVFLSYVLCVLCTQWRITQKCIFSTAAVRRLEFDFIFSFSSSALSFYFFRGVEEEVDVLCLYYSFSSKITPVVSTVYAVVAAERSNLIFIYIFFLMCLVR